MQRIALILDSIVVLAACASGCVNAPIEQAQTLEQKAYATYGTFVIVEEQADQLLHEDGTPADVKLLIARADARAKPSADALRQAFLDYDAAASAVKIGHSSEDQLATATQNLSTWLTHATVDIQSLVAAVKGN